MKFIAVNPNQTAHYSVGEAAKILNVSVRTLQRWDKNGVLVAHRTLGNRRYYLMSQLQASMDKREDDDRLTVIYSSVVNVGDSIAAQIDDIYKYANRHRINVNKVIADTTPSQDNLNQLIDLLIDDSLKTVLVVDEQHFGTHKYQWLSRLCQAHRTKIIPIQQENSNGGHIYNHM